MGLKDTAQTQTGHGKQYGIRNQMHCFHTEKNPSVMLKHTLSD
jgi:hypothetical protein